MLVDVPREERPTRGLQGTRAPATPTRGTGFAVTSPAAINVGKHSGSGIAQTCEPQRRRTHGTNILPWTVKGEENNASPRKKQSHKPKEMTPMRTTLECPETGRGSGRHILESKESCNAKKGVSRNIHGTQKDVGSQHIAHVPIWPQKTVPGALGATPLDNDTSTNHNRLTKWVITERRTNHPIRGGLGWTLGYLDEKTHPGRHGEVAEGSSQETNTCPLRVGIFCGTHGDGRGGQHVDGMVSGRSSNIVNHYGPTNIRGSDTQATEHQWVGKKSHVLGPKNEPPVVYHTLERLRRQLGHATALHSSIKAGTNAGSIHLLCHPTTSINHGKTPTTFRI